MFKGLAESSMDPTSTHPSDEEYDELTQVHPHPDDTAMDIDLQGSDPNGDNDPASLLEDSDAQDEEDTPSGISQPVCAPAVAPTLVHTPSSLAPVGKAAHPEAASSLSTPTAWGDSSRQTAPPWINLTSPSHQTCQGKGIGILRRFCASMGIKAKVADYQDVPQTLLLHAMVDYSSRILSVYVFPNVNTQSKWAADCWKVACHAAKERYILTNHMVKLITKRGSQIRGKILKKYRILFVTRYVLIGALHYGFVRSSTSAAIQANIGLAAKLFAEAALHYKDINDSTGYGGNTIITAVHQLTIFKDKHSLGVIFRSHFHPISLNTLALDFAMVSEITAIVTPKAL
ncbi:hypothetical protein C8J57DRAFT_1211393 [Mycena rebaudengoi]|nr:hypothetical protein C8J57DRAFT_1211393 [Mycena rebaudengoi]